MIKFLRDKWVKALRSNRYIQNRGGLRKGHKYCVFGVLCDIVNPKKWKLVDARKEVYEYDNFGEFDILSSSFRNKIGISLSEMYMIMRMNDDNKDFKYLADMIERQL